MADDEFQKESPRPEASPEPRPPEDDRRFQRRDPAWNSMALIAFCLGALSIVPLVTCFTIPWWLVNPREQYTWIPPAEMEPQSSDEVRWKEKGFTFEDVKRMEGGKYDEDRWKERMRREEEREQKRRLFDMDVERKQQDYYRRQGIASSVSMLCVFLDILLGPLALIFGVAGARYRRQYPAAGGHGFAMFGIVMGGLISLLFVAALCLMSGAIRIPVAGFK